MIKGGMLKTRMKRVADRGDRAVRRLAEIDASIANLSNEDLLDLADIFKAEPRSLIGDMAFAEMARRNISLCGLVGNEVAGSCAPPKRIGYAEDLLQLY